MRSGTGEKTDPGPRRPGLSVRVCGLVWWAKGRRTNQG
jgi:hypothetical protein